MQCLICLINPLRIVKLLCIFFIQNHALKYHIVPFLIYPLTFCPFKMVINSHFFLLLKRVIYYLLSPSYTRKNFKLLFSSILNIFFPNNSDNKGAAPWWNQPQCQYLMHLPSKMETQKRTETQLHRVVKLKRQYSRLRF